MKRLDIEFNWNGLGLSLFDGEYWCGEVRVDSLGYFENVWSSHTSYLEMRLAGQTKLESKLKILAETSRKLWSQNEQYDWVYVGFENDEGLDEFLGWANEVFDELRKVLRGKYEVNVDCRMEREYWLAGDKRYHGQKKRLKLMFDYGAWCLWLYDEYYSLMSPFNVQICDNGSFNDKMPEELLNGQTELMEMIDKLEKDYMALFINNEIEFSYKGFDNKQHAEDFVKLLNDIWAGLNRILGGKYKLYCFEKLGIEDWYREAEQWAN